MPSPENDTSQAQVHLDESKIREGIPPYDQSLRCRKHPKYPALDGFGLAGGGYGVYSFCQICSDIISKSETPD